MRRGDLDGLRVRGVDDRGLEGELDDFAGGAREGGAGVGIAERFAAVDSGEGAGGVLGFVRSEDRVGGEKIGAGGKVVG